MSDEGERWEVVCADGDSYPARSEASAKSAAAYDDVSFRLRSPHGQEGGPPVNPPPDRPSYRWTSCGCASTPCRHPGGRVRVWDEDAARRSGDAK